MTDTDLLAAPPATGARPRSGVGVAFGPGVDPHDRLSFTRGVVPAGGRLVDGVGFRPGAILPAPDWRPASPEQIAALCAPHDPEVADGVTVAVVRPAEGVLAPFARFGFASARTPKECLQKVRGGEYHAALEASLPHLADLLASADGVQLLGLCVQRGGLGSTTTHADEAGVTFSGLHVDDWDRLSLGQRHRSRRQMSINLGAEDRYFVFAEPPADVVAQKLGPALEQRTSAGVYSGLGAALFAHRPHTVLYRVRVRPGEAYMAPTDNLIHDGNTLGTTAPDVTVSLRGYFLTPA
jgi:hypothetical protein